MDLTGLRVRNLASYKTPHTHTQKNVWIEENPENLKWEVLQQEAFSLKPDKVNSTKLPVVYVFGWVTFLKFGQLIMPLSTEVRSESQMIYSA